MKIFSKKVRTVFGGLCIAMFLFSPSVAFALKFKHIIAFGDSLSDYNNLHTYFPDEVPVARTNGATWVMYLADEFNAITLDNNAFIGAMTSKHLYDDIQTLSDSEAVPQFGFVSQVDRFISENRPFEPSETLFTVCIGGNNLIRFGMENENNPTADPTPMIQSAMADIGYAFNKLLEVGAMHIAVLTVPDPGKAPYYNWRTEMEIIGSSLLASSYNQAMLTTVKQVVSIKPDVTIYEFDMFQIVDDIIEKEIFPNIAGSYMKLDDEFYALTETNGPAEDYLFYDSVHPTTKAHEYFAIEVAQEVMFHGYVTQQELDNAVLDERMKWDMKNDNRIGIEEAIQALKTCSGMPH